MNPLPLPSQKSVVSYSTAALGDFFSFFEKTVNDVYAYILHTTRVPEMAGELTLNVYFALLQRRRFFWWKTSVQMATVLAVTDKEIAGLPRWEEQATGFGYVEELLRCVKDGSERHYMQHLLHALRKLPLREQRLAVLLFFLHWPAATIAEIFGKKAQQVEKERETLAAHLCDELRREEGREQQGRSVPQKVCGVLSLIRCPALSEERKSVLRIALLERCQTTNISSMRFVFPVTAVVVVLGIFLATFLVPERSAQSTLEQIAALEVLLLDEEIAARNTYIAAEQDLIGIAAHAALGDVAQISLSLAPTALEQQLNEETALSEILEKLGESSLQRSKLLSSVEQ